MHLVKGDRSVEDFTHEFLRLGRFAQDVMQDEDRASELFVILGIDWLVQHYATLDYREKVVIFKISNDEEFRFRCDKSSMPQNIISAFTARKMLRRGCRGYLAVVRNVEAKTEAVKNVPVVCEFPDVFPKELTGLPPKREIKILY